VLGLNSGALDGNGEGPSGAQNADREEGAHREEPCLGCLKSALAGKSNGDCFENIKNNKITARCYKCASGHTCLPIPRSVLPAAKECLVLISRGWKSTDKAVVNKASSPSELTHQVLTFLKLRKYKSCVRVLLEIAKNSPENEIPEPLSTRRRALAHEEIEPQPLYEARVIEIKQHLLALVDLTIHRRVISAETLREFEDYEMVHDSAPEEEPEDIVSDQGDQGDEGDEGDSDAEF
jgi:hypothetical protein